MPASARRHETRALLRAHLAAASGYRHLTRHCPICHQLLRLAMASSSRPLDQPAVLSTEQPPVVQEASEDESPAGR